MTVKRHWKRASMTKRSISFDQSTVPQAPIPPPGFEDPTAGDLVLYLDADQIDPDVDVSAGNVTTWPDSSTFSNNASQTIIGARPTYMTASINGLPTVHFPVGTFLDLSSIVDIRNNDFTVFAVINHDSTVNTGGPVKYLISTNPGPSPTVGLVFGGNATGNITNEVITMYHYNGSVVRAASVTNISIATGPKLYTFGLSGSTEDIAIDDVPQSMTLGGFGGLDGALSESLYFNTVSYSGSSELLGELAVLLVFNSRLNAADEDYVYSFMSDKYGI